MRRIASDLEGRQNLGKTICARLHEAGIHSFARLHTLGAARAYKLLCERAGRRLAVGYYRYSLEGALRDIHWDTLTTHDKTRLREEAGLDKQVR